MPLSTQYTPPDPFASTYDSTLTSSLSDPYGVAPYLRKNTQNKHEESLTWGEMFDAAWTGVKTGIGSYAPETFYRFFRTIGSGLGWEGMEDWARQGIEENIRERTEDPWYKPDEAWMNKEWGRALYEGFANTTSSIATMVPGALAVAATAKLTGAAAGTLLLMRGAQYMGGSAASNLLGAVAEYDSFIDEAHRELSRIDPYITRDTVASDKFWQAALSGLAEGGMGMAQDVLGGKLAGVIGKNAARQGGHLVTRLIRNTYSNVATEMGEEAMTAYVQDYARELADLNHEGRWAAIQNILKPTLVSGILGGAGRTALGEAQNRTQEQPQAAPAFNPQEVIQRERLGKAREALSPHGFEMLQLLSSEGGADHQTSLATVTAMEALANRLSGESGEQVSKVFSTLDPGDPHLGRLVTAVQNKDADLDTVSSEAFGFLHSRLTPEAQAGIASSFASPEKAVAGFRKYLRNSEDKTIDEQARFGFSAMKNVLSDVVSATGNNSRLSVNNEVYNALKATDDVHVAPVAPIVSRDDAAFREAVSKDLNTEQLSRLVAYDALTGDSPKTAEALFLQWERTLEPLLEKVADTKRRRPDARTFREVAKEMSEAPGLDRMTEYFDKAYGGDKRMAVMNKIMEVAGQKVDDLARNFEADQSIENMAQLQALAMQYGVMQDFRNGTASEHGRALRMVGVSRSDNRFAEKLSAQVHTIGGAKKMEAFASAVQSARDAAERSMIIDGFNKTKTLDMFVEYTTANRLWAAPTHLVNNLSNSLMIFKSIIDKAYAQQTNTTGEGISAGTTQAYITGIWEAIRGMKHMWGAHRQEQGGLLQSLLNHKEAWRHSGFDFSELNNTGEMHRAITGANVMRLMVDPVREKLGLSTEHGRVSNGASSFIDFLGRIVNLPFEMLEASDSVFKNISYVAELHAQIHLAANGDASVIQRLHSNPPADLKALSMEHAKEMTFQQDLGKIGQSVNNIRNAQPLLRVFLPFLKTPINVLKEGISMTPFMHKLLGDFTQRLNSSDPAVRQLAEAKLMTGQFLWGTALTLAAAGYLTGPAPEDRDVREKQIAAGKRFNAVRIGDTYYQMDRLDPLAGILNSAAFIAEAADRLEGEELSQVMLSGLGQIMRLFTNRSYIASFGELIDAIQNPEIRGAAVARQLAGAVVPFSALGRSLNRDDPVMREAGDFQSQLMQYIPGLSRALPERRDFLGQPVRNYEYLGPMYLSPFQVGTETKDPVYREISRLHSAGLTAVPQPSKRFIRDGQRIEMAPEEYAAFLDRYGNKTKIEGKTLKQWIGAFIGSSEYKRLPDEGKADRLNLMVRKYSSKTRDEMYRTSPGMQKQHNAKTRGWQYLLGNSLNQ